MSVESIGTLHNAPLIFGLLIFRHDMEKGPFPLNITSMITNKEKGHKPHKNNDIIWAFLYKIFL